MARLQDFQTVTPTDSDNLLVVQATGQGLASVGSTLGAKLDKANPTGTGSLSLNRQGNTAVGTNSSALGTGAIANHLAQHVFGEYNLADTSTAQPTSRGNYVEIVGKGTGNNSRSNARTLDWSGNEVLAGGLKINGRQDVMPSVSQTSGQFNVFVRDGEMWLFIGQIASGDPSCMFLTHRVGSAMYEKTMFADSGFTFVTNNQGTVSIRYNSSVSNINVTAIRLK